jgi:hypothetical protein
MTVVYPLTDALLDRTRDVLCQYLQEHTGDNLRRLEILEIYQRPYSTIRILEAYTDHTNHRFVLKHIAIHPLNDLLLSTSNRAVAEYHILNFLYSRFLHVERCSVPNTVAIIPEMNAFLIEYIDGRLLADDLRFIHFLFHRREFQELQKHFYDSGRWLRHFQQFTARQHRGVNALDYIYKHCHHRLQLIEQSGEENCLADFRKIGMDFIERQIRELADVEFIVSGCHGDFGPWNTLVGPAGITVIDLFTYQEGPLPVDILSMLVYLDSIRHGIANSGTRIRTLRKRFLDGFGTLPEAPQPLILLCEAQQRIMQIAGAIIANEKGVCHRLERLRLMQAHVNWFSSCPHKYSLWLI